MNKLERIGCLYLTFLGHPGGLSFAQIRKYLPEAYPVGPGEDPESSRRKFERDKDELRALGMELKHHAAGETLPDGSLADASIYVIAEELQRLPEIEMSPGEVQTLSAVLMTALAEASENPHRKGASNDNESEQSRRALLESAAFKLLYKHPALLPNRTEQASSANKGLPDSDQNAPTTPHARPGETQQSETLGMIHSALSKRRRLEIVYAKKTGETRSRLVDGRGLISHRGRWCLVAHCLTSDGIRMFYVDRIAEARLSEEPARKDPNFDIQRYSLHPLALFIEAPIKIELCIDPAREDSWNDFISGLPPALLSKPDDSEPDTDEASHRYGFRTTNPRALFAWMVRFPGAVRRLGPPELLQRFAEYIALFRARYAQDSPSSGGRSA